MGPLIVGFTLGLLAAWLGIPLWEVFVAIIALAFVWPYDEEAE